MNIGGLYQTKELYWMLYPSEEAANICKVGGNLQSFNKKWYHWLDSYWLSRASKGSSFYLII